MTPQAVLLGLPLDAVNLLQASEGGQRPPAQVLPGTRLGVRSGYLLRVAAGAGEGPADAGRAAPSMRDGLFGMFGGIIRQLVDIGNADRGQNENRVDDGLPHHAGFGVAALARGQTSGLDEGA